MSAKFYVEMEEDVRTICVNALTSFQQTENLDPDDLDEVEIVTQKFISVQDESGSVEMVLNERESAFIRKALEIYDPENSFEEDMRDDAIVVIEQETGITTDEMDM